MSGLWEREGTEMMRNRERGEIAKCLIEVLFARSSWSAGLTSSAFKHVSREMSNAGRSRPVEGDSWERPVDPKEPRIGHRTKFTVGYPRPRPDCALFTRGCTRGPGLQTGRRSGLWGARAPW